MKFLSTLPARGATDSWSFASTSATISIHAPREGSDAALVGPGIHMGISIHAPREGSDVGFTLWDEQTVISIHAPREGSDGRTLLR